MSFFLAEQILRNDVIVHDYMVKCPSEHYPFIARSLSEKITLARSVVEPELEPLFSLKNGSGLAKIRNFFIDYNLVTLMCRVQMPLLSFKFIFIKN